MELHRIVPRTAVVGALLAITLVSGGALHAQNCGIGNSYCNATPNSTGQPASLAVVGSAVGGPGGAISLGASSVPSTAGLFFHGPNAVQIPFGNGFRCVGGTIQRTPVTVASGGAAAWTLATDAFAPGSTRRFQYWFRDPSGGPGGSNFSDAVAVTFSGGGCDHMGLNVVTPTSAAAGSTLNVTGAGLGSDPEDLCVMLVNGNQRALTRATAANSTSMALRVDVIPSAMTSGQVMVMRGDGDSSVPTGLPSDVSLPVPAWTWSGEELNASALSSASVALAPTFPIGPCQYYWGTVGTDGALRITLPGGSTCPLGATITMQLDASYRTGAGQFDKVSFDYAATYQSSITLNPCECAQRICAVYQQAFFQQKSIFLPCTTSVTGPCNTNPEVTLTFISPNFTSWLSGSVYVRICP